MNTKSFFSVIIFVVCVSLTWSENQKKHSRVRRYLTFPEGSIFTAVFCLTNLMGITPGSDIFSMNINWGLAYELPNDTKPLLDVYKPAMKRRNRRDLYGRIEMILTSMGYNGKTCILRSLCEAEQRFLRNEENLFYKILGLIFRFPQEPILDHEPDIHHIYHYASQIGRSNEETEHTEEEMDKCSKTFKCSFSLIDLALGFYSLTDT